MCGGGGGSDPIYETEADREAIKIAVEQYNIGKDLEPLKDYQEAAVDARSTDGADSFVQGKANIGIQKEFGKAINNANQGLHMAGVDPSSGRATGMNDAAHVKMGETGAKGMSDAAYENESNALAGRQDIINVSMGKQGSAQKGLNDIAGMATSEAIGDAFNDFNEHAADTQAFGTAAGMGASAYMNATNKSES